MEEGNAVSPHKIPGSAQELGRTARSSDLFTDLPAGDGPLSQADFIFNNDFCFRDRYGQPAGLLHVNQSKMKIAAVRNVRRSEKGLSRARYRFDS